MKRFLYILSAILIFNSCAYERSPVTGWDYNNPVNGGFEKRPYQQQETGPGLILIEGGSLLIPLDSDVENKGLTVKIPSFYMDQTEVANKDWQEYLYWVSRTFGQSFPVLYHNALPDTSCWKEVVGNYEAYQANYLRHPAYSNYPVVGIDWMQANNFCSWRTDRVNEAILIREGILVVNPMQQDEPFTTEAYLAGQYDLGLNEFGQVMNLNPSSGGYSPATGKYATKEMATRNVTIQDGILLPRYRLPTEAEWEYAASYGTDLNSKRSKSNRKNWDKKGIGLAYFANWKAGNSIFQNESGITNLVIGYLPNDAGLYHMHSNVSEWVADVYQLKTEENIHLIAPKVNLDQVEVVKRTAESYSENKYVEVIYDVYEMQNYMHTFKKTTNAKLKGDSIQQYLLEYIEFLIYEAICEYDRDDFLKGSRLIRRIFDDVILSNADNVERANSGERIEHQEIYDALRRGLSQFVLYHPGQLPTRNQTPEESIGRRNINNKLDWVVDYDEKLDSLSIVNEDRVVKGRSFVNSTGSADTYHRTGVNKYEAACYVGFRCAMQRVGSPIGLGKK